MNAVDRWGGTPLKDAAREGHTTIRDVLLEVPPPPLRGAAATSCSRGGGGGGPWMRERAGLRRDGSRAARRAGMPRRRAPAPASTTRPSAHDADTWLLCRTVPVPDSLAANTSLAGRRNCRPDKRPVAALSPLAALSPAAAVAVWRGGRVRGRRGGRRGRR